MENEAMKERLSAQEFADSERVMRFIFARLERLVKATGYGTPENPFTDATFYIANEIVEREMNAHNAFCDRFISERRRAPNFDEIVEEFDRRERLSASTVSE